MVFFKKDTKEERKKNNAKNSGTSVRLKNKKVVPKYFVHRSSSFSCNYYVIQVY
jgi:hypothetical protein